MKNWFFTTVTYVGILIAGIVIGCIWNNVPFFTLDPQINIADLVNLFVTIFIAVVVAKIFQYSLAIKTYMIEELGELVDLVKLTHKVIADAYSAGSFSSTDRDKLMFAFHSVELKLGSIETQMSAAFPKRSIPIMQSLMSSYLDYKNHLTGGEIMFSSFTQVSNTCYRDCSTQHSKIETAIKTTLQKVHKL